MITRTDDLKRQVQIKGPALRIVCLVPSITETLFALGAGERLVGITDYCIHPEIEVESKTRVGGTKNFHVDKVLALAPELVVANAEENRRHQIERLEQEGIKVFVTFPKSVEGCLKMIEDMAVLTATETAARRLIKEIESARSAARSDAQDNPPRILCPIWKEPYMTINRDTYVDGVIRECGGENIFQDSADRYPQFTLKEAARRKPDVILLPTEPYHFRDADKTDFRAMGSEVPAVRNRRIHIVEGELLTWYGPRLGCALTTISSLLRGRTDAGKTQSVC